MTVKCGELLWRMGTDVPVGVPVHCGCGCYRVWQHRERTLWLTLAFWRRRRRGATRGRVWVRLSKSRSFALRVAEERG